MTEYWKSNPRKFCDYCKCWFADNRPSIEFHEAGKKHKENVAKRLQEIGRKGKEDYDNSLKMEDYMLEMEQAALKAYKTDIGSNPDMTGSTFAAMAKEKNADIVLRTDPKAEASKQQPTDSKWHEAKSKDGVSYYYHVETKETKWESPLEGFISIDKQKLRKKKKSEKRKHTEDGSKNTTTSNKKSSKTASIASSDCATVSPECEQTKPKQTPIRKPPTNKSYGSWTTVEKPVVPDLQLPVLPGWEEEDLYYGSLPKEAPHQFTQKTVTLSGTAATTSFKKRKNADGNKKNAMTRNNDL